MGLASLNVHQLNGIPLNGPGPIFVPTPPPDTERGFLVDAECRIFLIPAETTMEVCESQVPIQVNAEDRTMVVAKTPLR